MSFKQQLTQIKTNSKPISTFETYYKGKLRTMNVYEVDISLLKFNYLNGRIGSEVLEYQQTKGLKLKDLSVDEANQIISSWVWKKSKGPNEKTYKDIKDKGQIMPGIITSDGIVVDGNRRLMLLMRLKQIEGIDRKFKTAILDETYEDSIDAEFDIKKLETQIQLGQDEKVNYAANEKYLRVIDFIDNYVKEGLMQKEEIVRLMDFKNTSEVDEIYKIGQYMIEYLEHIGAKNIWSRLDNTEDLFISLSRTHSLYEKSKGNAGWNFSEDDVFDFKIIGFELIRFIYNHGEKNSDFNPKLIRELYFSNSRNKSIFSNQRIWERFKNSIEESLDSIDIPTISQVETEKGIGASQAAKEVDFLFANQVSSSFKEAIGTSKSKIIDKENENEPEKFIKASLDKLENLIDEDKFHSDKTVVFKENIFRNLERGSDLEKIKTTLKDISKICYELGKKI